MVVCGGEAVLDWLLADNDCEAAGLEWVYGS
jgi:hypothetical protein